MADFDQALYDSAVAKMQKIKGKIGLHDTEVAGYEKKIERIKSAKKTVKRLKEQAEEVKSSASKKNVTKKLSLKWEGNKYNKYVDIVDGDVKQQFKSYVRDIDRCLDALVSRQTYYENQILDKKTILSGLWISLNKLKSEVAKMLN